MYVILLFCDDFLESYKAPDDADAKHDVTKAGNAGNGCVGTACEWGAEHLGNASYEEHDAGGVKTNVVKYNEFLGEQLVVGHGTFKNEYQECHANP